MIDWKSRLTAGMRGVTVEGKDDRIVLEAFLDAGEKEGHWSDWRRRLAIEVAGGVNPVLRELDAAPPLYEVWALLDQEWRPLDNITDLQRKYPRLLFLPRVMIENYTIDPDELVLLLPPHRLQQLGEASLRQQIEKAKADWLLHGALSQVLHEHGAGDFGTRTEGYPNRLLNPPYAPVTDETEIERWLRKWHEQLDPDVIIPTYRQRVTAFRARSHSEQYHHCIEGKLFFQEIIVGQILNRAESKKKSGEWLETIFMTSSLIQCPSDLIPLLTRLVGAL